MNTWTFNLEHLCRRSRDHFDHMPGGSRIFIESFGIRVRYERKSVSPTNRTAVSQQPNAFPEP
jgi:hypothetical protein